MDLEKKVFEGKSMSSLFKEIYDNSKSTRKQVSKLVKDLIGTELQPGLAESVKEFLEIGVKNDEQLIKLATVIQRLETAGERNGDKGSFSDAEELQKLLEEQEQLEKQVAGSKKEEK